MQEHKYPSLKPPLGVWVRKTKSYLLRSAFNRYVPPRNETHSTLHVVLARVGFRPNLSLLLGGSTPSVKTENGTIVLAAPNVEIEGDGGRRTVATTDMIDALR